MPGNPLLNKMIGEIEELGGEDWFFEQVADGRTFRDIAGQFGRSRALLYKWLVKHVPEYEDKLKAARLIAAHAHVEDALVILDEADGSSQPGVIKAKERANFRKWLASVQNRKAYGEQSKGPVIALNINSLHLDALKAAGVTSVALPGGAREALPPGVVPVADYEVVEEGEGG
jgi:transposase-like protein